MPSSKQMEGRGKMGKLRPLVMG